MNPDGKPNTKTGIKPAETLRRVLADSQGNLPNRIQVLRAGDFKTMKYGDMEIRVTDLQEMVSNFQAGLGLNDGGSEGAPLNFGHDIGGPAAAWIKGLKLEGDELYADPVEWTENGKKSVLSGDYKFVSSEFWLRALGQVWHNSENYDESATNVYEGCALTNIPMFSGQKSIFASREGGDDKSDGLYINISASVKENKDMPTLEQVLAKENDSLSEDERKILASANDEGKLNAEQQAKYGFQVKADKKEEPVLENMQPVQASAVRGDEGNVVMAAKDIVELRKKAEEASTLADRVKALEGSAKASLENEMKVLVEKHAARGAIKADRVESWTKRLVEATEADRAELQKDLEGMADNPALASEQGDGSHKQGDATNTAADKIKAKAAELIKAAKEDGKTLSEGEAFSQVLRADRELAEDYNRQIQGKE